MGPETSGAEGGAPTAYDVERGPGSPRIGTKYPPFESASQDLEATSGMTEVENPMQLKPPVIGRVYVDVPEEEQGAWGKDKTAGNGDKAKAVDEEPESQQQMMLVSIVVCIAILAFVLLVSGANGDGPFADDPCECYPGAGFYAQYKYDGHSGCSNREEPDKILKVCN